VTGCAFEEYFLDGYGSLPWGKEAEPVTLVRFFPAIQ
jgi:hypothetical protein